MPTIWRSGTTAGDDVAWRVEGLDLVRMRACAQRFVGEHDYKVFSAGGKASGTTVRTIRAAVVEELEHVDLPFVGRVQGPLVRVGFEGDGFLKHQVRRMVGALVRVGRGELAERRGGHAARDLATPRPARYLLSRVRRARVWAVGARRLRRVRAGRMFVVRLLSAHLTNGLKFSME